MTSPYPFKVRIIDPCDNPESLSAPKEDFQKIVEFDYTITQAALSYQAPAFIPTPIWCPVTYSYETDVPEIVNFDPADHVFKIWSDDSFDLIDSETQITLRGELGNGNGEIVRAEAVVILLKVKSPCNDPEYVEIS